MEALIANRETIIAQGTRLIKWLYVHMYNPAHDDGIVFASESLEYYLLPRVSMAFNRVCICLYVSRVVQVTGGFI